MPIYAYRCEACGFAKDALQKVSDAPLTECPSCNQSAFKKQLTAAGFQLKGSGWYVTDFRSGSAGTAKPAANTAEPAAAAASADAGTTDSGSSTSSETSSGTASGTASTATASAS